MNGWHNWFTLSRLFAAALLPAVFLLPQDFGTAADKAALAVFAFGALTDFADGFFARRLKRVSQFGALLDTVADKILVAVALFLLVDAMRAPVLPALIIVCREIAVSALREWTAAETGGGRLAVAAAGKIKTAAQMIAIIVLFYNDSLFAVGREEVLAAGRLLLWFAAALSVYSFALYAMRARQTLRK